MASSGQQKQVASTHTSALYKDDAVDISGVYVQMLWDNVMTDLNPYFCPSE